AHTTRLGIPGLRRYCLAPSLKRLGEFDEQDRDGQIEARLSSFVPGRGGGVLAGEGPVMLQTEFAATSDRVMGMHRFRHDARNGRRFQCRLEVDPSAEVLQ